MRNGEFVFFYRIQDNCEQSHKRDKCRREGFTFIISNIIVWIVFHEFEIVLQLSALGSLVTRLATATTAKRRGCVQRIGPPSLFRIRGGTRVDFPHPVGPQTIVTRWNCTLSTILVATFGWIMLFEEALSFVATFASPCEVF